MATITQTTQPQTAANPPTGSLVVKNLQKSFKKRQVVKDFSLDIRTGEVVGLLGPNGAGKTTFAREFLRLYAVLCGT